MYRVVMHEVQFICPHLKQLYYSTSQLSDCIDPHNPSVAPRPLHFINLTASFHPSRRTPRNLHTNSSHREILYNTGGVGGASLRAPQYLGNEEITSVAATDTTSEHALSLNPCRYISNICPLRARIASEPRRESLIKRD